MATAFGEVMRGFREKAGLSQEALADRAGLHRTYVSMLERGKRNATLLVVSMLAAALAVTMTAMIGELEKRLRSRTPGR